MSHVLALDLGGSKLGVGAVSSDGELSFWQKVAVETGKDSTYLLDLVLETVSAKLKEVRRRGREVLAAGMGSPGPLDYERGIILNPPNLPWRQIPLKEIIFGGAGLAAGFLWITMQTVPFWANPGWGPQRVSMESFCLRWALESEEHLCAMARSIMGS